MSSFFDLKQLVSPVHHLVDFKRVSVFLENEFPLCLDDFIVTLPYHLAIITNPHQLGLQPKVASLVSKYVRQSPVADSGLESVALSHQSLIESDLSPLWLALSPLTSTTESLSQSMVLPKASAANLSLGSAAALTGLEGR